jgi:hypothetical protein
MAATKSQTTCIATGTSNAAGATTTGTVVNLTTTYSATVTVKLTNGATAPTVPGKALVYISGDNVDFNLFQTLTGDTVNSSFYNWDVTLPPAAAYCRVDLTGNTGQAITGEALVLAITGI